MRRVLLMALLAGSVAVAQEALVLRAGVIGGMVTSGFWEALSHDFRARSGIAIEVVASGPKHPIDVVARQESLDIVTMHSSDVMAHLVGEGLYEGLTPWVKNRQALLGPSSNPAGLLPTDTLEQAMTKLVATKAPVLIGASAGSLEVWHRIEQSLGITLHEEQRHFSAKTQGFLREAQALNAYVLFGDIPFAQRKLGASPLVRYGYDSPLLERPYVAIIGTQKRIGKARYDAARQFLDYLRSVHVKAIINSYRQQNSQEQIFFAF
ncbi:MAG: hypothetical protein KU37_03625 [Sulfuricurvum sp. PC08-66]|nr:MAG: hypothetical protein KU37_03625 [Sulfuricurvum sp. PC08-66]